MTTGQGGLAYKEKCEAMGATKMRNGLCAVVFAMLLAVPAGAQEDPIRQTIQSQIDAFMADDVARAFSFASPTIQSMFGTPENFGRMVRSGYPAIWRPSRTQYLGMRTEGDRVLQRMLFAGPDGSIAVYDYEMTKGADGWKINGVYPVDQPSVGA